MWPFRSDLSKVAAKLSDAQLVKRVHERLPNRYEKFTELQRCVWAVWWLRAELLNGGIGQYFTNSAADDYPMLRTFLKEVGADETLAALYPFGDRFLDGSEVMHRDQRIDYAEAQEENNESAWQAIVSKATNVIERTFPDMNRKVGAHLRANLDAVEPN